MKIGIMQPYFLPYIGYWQLFSLVDSFVIYDNVQYTKKGWINRNRFLQDGKETVFTIPVKNDSSDLDVVRRAVAESFERQTLLNRLAAAYRKAPYFEDVFPILEDVIRNTETNLFEYIKYSIEVVAKFLGIQTPLIVSSRVEIDHWLRGQERVLALCRSLGASTYVNPTGGAALYSKETFATHGIDLRFLRSRQPAYRQFQDRFVPNLSIIDAAMFNSRSRLEEMLVEFDLE